MRKRKVTALLMGTLIAVSAFAGCGNGDSSSGMNIVSKAESKASSATEDDNSSKVESKTSVAGNTEPGGSGAEEVIQLNLGGCQQPDHITSLGADEFAARVKEATNGEVEIVCYHAETLGTNSELAAGCAAGTVDIYFSAMSQYGTYCPQETVLDAFFMFKDWDHMQRYMETEDYANIVSAVENATTTHVLGSIYYGTRNLYTAKKEIRSVDDMKGLKLRVPNEPMPVACVEAMGASSTPINYGEVYMALQNGTVDGGEGAPSSLVAMNFYEVSQYLSMTAHQVQALTFFMSDAAKNRLTEEQYETIKTICEEVSAEYSEKAVEEEKQNIDFLKKNMTVIEDVGTDSFVDACKNVWIENEEAWGKGVWEKIQELR